MRRMGKSRSWREKRAKPWMEVRQKFFKWRGLRFSSAEPNDYPKLDCRGLWKQHVVDVLSQLVGEKSPNVLFHMETKQSINEMRWIQVRLPYRCMLAVPSIRRSGGLALLWMEEIDLHIQTFTLNHIDVLILSDPNTP